MVEDNSVKLSKHGLTIEALVRINDNDVKSEIFYMDDVGISGRTILENKKFDEEDTDHIIKNVQVIRVLNVNNSD